MRPRNRIPHKLQSLQSQDPAINAWVGRVLGPIVNSIFETLIDLIGEEGDFTAAIAGASTAGTYEIASQRSRYYRTGDLVHVTVDITLAGAITAGGTGALALTGLPLYKLADYYPVGSILTTSVDLTPGVHNVLVFDSTTNASNALRIVEVNDNAADAALAIGSLAAGDRISGSITYVTSGVRG